MTTSFLSRLTRRHAMRPWLCNDDPTPPPPTGGGPQPPPAPPTPARPSGQSDAERAQFLENQLATTRAEAAANRVEARTANERIQGMEREIATIRTEAEARVQTAQSASNVERDQIRTRLIDAELKAAAVSAGLVDPDLLPLIPKGAITFQPDGSILGIPEAVADFKSKKPTYFRAAEAPPAPAPRITGSPTPAPAPNPLAPVTTVASMPKADYDTAKRAALRSLR